MYDKIYRIIQSSYDKLKILNLFDVWKLVSLYKLKIGNLTRMQFVTTYTSFLNSAWIKDLALARALGKSYVELNSEQDIERNNLRRKNARRKLGNNFKGKNDAWEKCVRHTMQKLPLRDEWTRFTPTLAFKETKKFEFSVPPEPTKDTTPLAALKESMPDLQGPALLSDDQVRIIQANPTESQYLRGKSKSLFDLLAMPGDGFELEKETNVSGKGEEKTDEKEEDLMEEVFSTPLLRKNVALSQKLKTNVSQLGAVEISLEKPISSSQGEPYSSSNWILQFEDDKSGKIIMNASRKELSVRVYSAPLPTGMKTRTDIIYQFDAISAIESHGCCHPGDLAATVMVIFKFSAPCQRIEVKNGNIVQAERFSHPNEYSFAAPAYQQLRVMTRSDLVGTINALRNVDDHLATILPRKLSSKADESVEEDSNSPIATNWPEDTINKFSLHNQSAQPKNSLRCLHQETEFLETEKLYRGFAPECICGYIVKDEGDLLHHLTQIIFEKSKHPFLHA